MTRQIKFAALLTIMTLALGGLARAQWDDDDDYYQRGNGAQARQSGYQNGYHDGVKHGRHEGRENDPEDFRLPDDGQARRGYRDWMGPTCGVATRINSVSSAVTITATQPRQGGSTFTGNAPLTCKRRRGP